jgi:hypothetical protein
MCNYIDPETLKLVDKKMKLTLKSDNGTIEEYSVIPMRDSRRSLLVSAENEARSRKVWNEQTQREEIL